MADRLTQLQECLDQLATQMFASLRYIASHHPIPEIAGQPHLGPAIENQSPTTNGVVHRTEEQEQPASTTSGRDNHTTFSSAVNELAQDLVAKEQQIEYLIKSLPGRSRSQAEQQERMRELNQQLEDMDTELEEAAKEKAKMLERVENVMWKVKRY